MAANIICTPLKIAINSSLREASFPDNAKRAAISPIFKSDENTGNKNYRPISILNTLSMIFESISKEQLVPHFEKC